MNKINCKQIVNNVQNGVFSIDKWRNIWYNKVSPKVREVHHYESNVHFSSRVRPSIL